MNDLQKEIDRLPQIKEHIREAHNLLDTATEAIERAIKAEGDLVVYKKALQLACEDLRKTGATYFTPGGNSLEYTFAQQAKWELGQHES